MKQITVTYASGTTTLYPVGIVAGNALGGTGPFAFPLAAVLVDNELKSANSLLEHDCTIQPVLTSSSQGAATYRRSLCFLLAIAARELYPDRRLVAGMAIGTGFYHFFDDDQPVDPQNLDDLAQKMRQLVKRDVSITLEEWPWYQAMKLFQQSGQKDTLLLLDHSNEPVIQLNECAGFRDLHTSPLVPSTGVLTTWELVPYHDGFLVRYPHKETPAELTKFKDEPVLYAIAEEYRERGKVLGAGSVGALNRVTTSGKIQDYITVAETLQNKKLAAIADKIADGADRIKVVLIAGPSSSGKTTSSKKLAIQLRVMGFTPITIELDNYFVNRDRTPLDSDGKPDFECLDALDIACLNEQLVTLFEGGQVELPLYDFKLGIRRPSGKLISLNNNEILILEGIHGLNDNLTPLIPAENKFKVYVSALTQLNLDDHNRISTTDYRLLRRLVRDNKFRGHSALKTLGMWDSVQRGERTWIFPFQNSADAVFNSALDYELGVLKVYAEPQLRTVKSVHPEYAEARRIQAFLDNFSPIPTQHVPSDSILREFIGDSDFKY